MFSLISLVSHFFLFLLFFPYSHHDCKTECVQTDHYNAHSILHHIVAAVSVLRDKQKQQTAARRRRESCSRAKCHIAATAPIAYQMHRKHSRQKSDQTDKASVEPMPGCRGSSRVLPFHCHCYSDGRLRWVCTFGTMLAQTMPDATSAMYRNQHHRFQNFIDSAYLLAEHSGQKIELLIIEWNPPENKRRILDAFVCDYTLFLNGCCLIEFTHRDSADPNI